MAGVESGRHRDCHLFAESAGAQFIRMTEVDAVARVIQAGKLLPGFLRNEPALLQPLDHLSGPAWVIHVLQGQSRLPDCQAHQGFHGRNSVHRDFPCKHHFYGAIEGEGGKQIQENVAGRQVADGIGDKILRSFVFFIAEGIHGILRSQCLHGADVAGGKRIARSLNMTDLSGNVLKTFSDYSEEPDLQLSLVEAMPRSSWHGKSLAELRLPSGMATALILRGKEKPIPHGETILQAQDTLVFVDSGSLR